MVGVGRGVVKKEDVSVTRRARGPVGEERM